MVDAAICDGDFVVVRQQPVADNGDIVAAMIDGEATVKTFQRRDGHVLLLPHNPAYSPIDGDHARIVGKVIKVSTRPPTRGADLGIPKKFMNTARPSKPNTMDGTAARLLMFTSMKSVIRFLGAISSR